MYLSRRSYKLVVDGSVGRNAVDQAAAWRQYVGVTGLAVTKLDGTARGGFVVAVVKDLGLPIKYIGVGEKITDLRDFEPDVFVDALLGNDEAASARMEARVRQFFFSSSIFESFCRAVALAVSAGPVFAFLPVWFAR